MLAVISYIMDNINLGQKRSNFFSFNILKTLEELLSYFFYLNILNLKTILFYEVRLRCNHYW